MYFLFFNMRKVIAVTLTLVIWFSDKSVAESEVSQLETYLPIWRTVRSFLFRYLGGLNHSPENMRKLLKEKKFQEVIPDFKRFPCDVNLGKSANRPKSVHGLRPGDIKIIGAIGDSITAGAGVTSSYFFSVVYEERGVAFSIGGEKTWRQYLTLPNILKEFNPKLIGYSLKASQTIEWESQFNVAETGLSSKHIYDMSKVLIKRIQSDRRIDWRNDWKMISIFIGCNDFCSDFCFIKDPRPNLDQHRDDLIKTLRNLRDNLPNTFVNLIPPPNLQTLESMTNYPGICQMTHQIECPCLFGLQYKKLRQLYFDLMPKWQQIDLEVANLDEFDLDNFADVAQPFFIDYQFPKDQNGEVDLSFLAVDCFHFSQKLQAKSALDLWNNILEPVGNKSTGGWPLLSKFNCPTTDRPLIFTKRNSKLSK